MASVAIARCSGLQATLLGAIGADLAVCNLLAESSHEGDNSFCEAARAIANQIWGEAATADFASLSTGNTISCICTWAGRLKTMVPSGLKTAIENRHKNQDRQRKIKRDYIRNFALHRSPEERDQYLSAVPILTLPRLRQPYPPAKFSVYETKQAGDRWRHFLRDRKQHDPRTGTKPMMYLDPSKLRKTIEADESRIIKDEEGNLVGVVLRNFCVDGDALEWVNATISSSTEIRKSIRASTHHHSIVYLSNFPFYPARRPRQACPGWVHRRLAQCPCL